MCVCFFVVVFSLPFFPSTPGRQNESPPCQMLPRPPSLHAAELTELTARAYRSSIRTRYHPEPGHRPPAIAWRPDPSSCLLVLPPPPFSLPFFMPTPTSHIPHAATQWQRLPNTIRWYTRLQKVMLGRVVPVKNQMLSAPDSLPTL